MSLALPMNRDITTKFNILLWWKLKGAPRLPIMSCVRAFGFVHPMVWITLYVENIAKVMAKPSTPKPQCRSGRLSSHLL